ncbi:hypothetical protein CXG50_16145 [Pseudomonas plecoglossicida]|jgi:hypothetical protein|uniref:Uncharacterized protein n=2 Tax=Pseudomonas putida group TaxID=136845 RepID=A0ABX4UAH9_PSEDL|nr:hypothetical protein B479_15715 [Pseudomonas putida HB3267]PJI72578.1 hypothetical protein CSW00_17200 [Pseudomonas sp. MR 02]PLP92623.1 hypothetical protein CX682_06415 [Pseudomonas sp. FFUP_PS_41]PLU86632.1 hypothetical protein CXG44_14600 [Pseudomonas plecoglossicida]RNF87282.1 hypothetical protein EFK07_17490 [Pseudomonas putida]
MDRDIARGRRIFLMMVISARQVVAKENGSAFVPAGQPLQMGVLRWCVVITTAVFVVQMTR